MAQMKQVTRETLAAFTDAWNLHDVDALMSFMTDDCVFESAAGVLACGARHEGREAVAAAFAQAWTVSPDAHWGNGRHWICGDRGVSEWTLTGTRTDGSRLEVEGCDLFTFREGRIAVKKAFRKDRPLIVAAQQ